MSAPVNFELSYLTINEVMEALRLSRNTVKRRIAAGDFGADVVNLGSGQAPDYRIPKRGIRKFLLERRIFQAREAHDSSVVELSRAG
jgi:hypothetical protein